MIDADMVADAVESGARIVAGGLEDCFRSTDGPNMIDALHDIADAINRLAAAVENRS